MYKIDDIVKFYDSQNNKFEGKVIKIDNIEKPHNS